ncbi:MAG: SIMPL domain-containing protein [Candidatus Paceibacterota bacterium]
MEISQEYKINIYRALLALMVILSLYFAVRLASEFRAYGMIGSAGSHTITLTGHGEVMAVPDIASVYFTISKEAKTVKEAQDAVAVVEKKALDFLKENGVAEKDIQASNASFYPKYEYKARTPAIYAYEASESITVKVRNTDDAGRLIQGLGTLGVSNLNGPNFTIDDEESLKAEARKAAIAEAKTKAEVLAKDLGVKLGRVAEFSESGNYPMYYAKDARLSIGEAQASDSAPELPKGENTVSVDVVITYEIR